MENGHLINKAGYHRYCKAESVGNLIRYIARERKNEDRREELLAFGVLGCPDVWGTEAIIGGFALARKCYARRGSFGRYVDHEIYEFSGEELMKMLNYHIDLEHVAEALAKNIYDDGHQVFWGIHFKDKESVKIHIHFAVNAVNFKTGKKRHENWQMTQKREQAMQKIVSDEIQKGKAVWQSVFGA